MADFTVVGSDEEGDVFALHVTADSATDAVAGLLEDLGPYAYVACVFEGHLISVELPVPLPTALANIVALTTVKDEE